jgi:hypothetical protein
MVVLIALFDFLLSDIFKVEMVISNIQGPILVSVFVADKGIGFIFVV